MALANLMNYLTDSEGDSDVEEDTPPVPVQFSAPTPVAAAAPPGPRRPPPVQFSAPTTVAAAVPPVEPSAGPLLVFQLVIKTK